MQKLDALAAAVKAEMDRQKLNTYEVAERATNRGYKIVHGTVWNVINQNVKEVKDKTIVALARGLGIQEESLFAVVRGNDSSEKISDERFYRIAKGYAQLPEAEKQTLEPFLIAIETSISISKGLSEEKINLISDEKVAVKKNVAQPKKKRTATPGKVGSKNTFISRDGKSLPLIGEAATTDDEEEEK